ncbi:periplasmic heavy metal sensor [Novosphingobium terrae]|uniref:periplasmic heavy metal sensor n=1 Tax=Novosphingobium terrae TaxID=2726189 RepID=UPI00197F0AEB|nr:periplasmic heavy metal sensor [Novosphingobium terrae]
MLLGAALAFVAALGGVLAGHHLLAPAPPPESALHSLLHEQLDLDTGQKARLSAIEQDFALRKQALESRLRAANTDLAAAIQAEHGYGPRVAAAVDATHHAMGDLQKATLEHVFAMRGVLRPDQTARYDAAVVKALTDGKK